jgi:hypothetical protein
MSEYKHCSFAISTKLYFIFIIHPTPSQKKEENPMILVIAEKPSVGMSLAAVLGAEMRRKRRITYKHGTSG